MRPAINEVNKTAKDDGVVILIAEDDDIYYLLMEKVLRRSGISNGIVRFKDGQEVIDFLQNQTESRNIFNPEYLLILDINMPKLDGIEVLKRIKQSDNLKHIPVVMNSSTDDPDMIDLCYCLGCADYVVKGGDSANILQILSNTSLLLSKA